MADYDASRPPAEASRIAQITFQGNVERAEDIGFEATEAWSNYRLEDGTVIKLKNVVSRILRLLDRTRDDGSPFYVVEGSAILTTILPSGENRLSEHHPKQSM